MYDRVASILIGTLSIVFISFAVVDQAPAMQFGKHRGGGGGSNSAAGASLGSTSLALNTIDAQAFQTPVPEPSTIMLLGGGVLALGLWRLKKQTGR